MVLYETPLQSYENLGEKPNFTTHFYFYPIPLLISSNTWYYRSSMAKSRMLAIDSAISI